MNRPYNIYNSLMSLNGKKLRYDAETPELDAARDAFRRIAFGKQAYYQHQGWLADSSTSNVLFTKVHAPTLTEDAAVVLPGDFLAKTNADHYYMTIDPSGKLGWESNTLQYANTSAHVVEVLTDQASNAYKAYLRSRGISYIMAGEENLDYAVMLEKAYRLLNIKALMLAEGSAFAWPFLQVGMCSTELSFVVAPVIIGAVEEATIFQAPFQLANSEVFGFLLHDVDVLDGGVLWVRYQADKGDKFQFSWDKTDIPLASPRADSLPEYGVQYADPDPF